MKSKEIEEFHPETNQALRQWFEKNHLEKDAVWLIFYKKTSGKPRVSWSDAVDEALCFGWIDSKAETLDQDRYRQYFCKRKASSTWSKINKDKIIVLTEQGLMFPAGFQVIEIAKRNGTWTTLDDAEELKLPSALETAFYKQAGAMEFYESLSKSKKKLLLHWIALAKTEPTKEKRIAEIAESAGQQLLPKTFRPK